MENLYGLNYKKEIEIISDIPCALFKNQTPLPPHTPIHLNFKIDSNNYHINLINYAGAFPTANVVAQGTTNVVSAPPTIVRMPAQDSQVGPQVVMVLELLTFGFIYIVNNTTISQVKFTLVIY